MFGEQFYPTPNKLIQKMISSLNLSDIDSILEPSAGKGDIAEAVANKYNSLNLNRYNPCNIDCIEIDPSLSSILKGKGLRVVHDDFLSFNHYKKYDLIIMNPPFKNGEKHLLKALEMQREGGHIICLLNANTIRTPDSSARKELLSKLKSENVTYDVEYLENEFSEAERRTNVEVALIKISVQKQKKPSYFRAKLEKARLEKEIKQPEIYEVAENDLIGQIVKQFDLEVEMGINFIKEYHSMLPYTLSKIDSHENSFDRHTLELSLGGSSDDRISINGYLETVRKKYWLALFANKSFISQLTSGMITDLYNRIENLKNYDFSYYNVKQLQLELNQNISLGVESTILKVFDELSHQYSYTDYSNNVHLYNGWKTNKSWYINKKVIIPFNGLDSWGNVRLDTYKIQGRFNDIEKSLNYLNGNKPLAIDLTEEITKAIDRGETKLHLNFFDVVFYKKGTAHITFNDLDLLKRLNLFAGRKKSWLPPSYGQKRYEDMDNEEQSVINDFEGVESYNETMANSSKWLVNTQKTLTL